MVIYTKEQTRRRNARVKARRPIKKALLKLGAKETKDDLIVFIDGYKGITIAHGIIWVKNGKVFIRWANLGPAYAEKLINEFLDLKPGSLPAGNAIRREMVRGLIKGQYSVEKFYDTVLRR